MEYLFLAALFAALFGTIIGSFLNVVILRLPHEDTSIAYPASHCPLCQHPLSWYENIPVISYLALRGRCRSCHKPISIQYPLVEAAQGLICMALALRYGLSLEFFCYTIFSAALVAITVIDLQQQIIPDKISLPGIPCGIIFAIFSNQLSWQDASIGAIAGGGILYAIAYAYYLLRKQQGMGGGDIKLLAMLGAWLGWQSLPFIIFASSFSGALIGIIALRCSGKGTATRIPFGPFLAGAALCYLFFSTEISHFSQLYLQGQLL